MKYKVSKNKLLKNIKHRVFNIRKQNRDKIIREREVELVGFTFMPNHFHLIVRELTDDGTGISNYMKRVLGGFAKYSNVKYGETGHVFQGTFGAVHIEDNNQLLYLSTYIHKNPREIKKWKNMEDKYPWSSYQDYVTRNHWGELLETDIITAQFKNNEEYKDFVITSPAKEEDQ